MTRLIKASAAPALVGRFVAPAALCGPLGNGGPQAAVDPRLAAALEEMDTLRAAVDAAKAAEEEARADGRRHGLAEAAKAQDRQLQALAASLSTAMERWNERLASLEPLALLVARTALSKLLGEDCDHAQRVARTLALQIAQMRREAVIRVRVSADDFPDSAALRDLAEAADTGSLDLLADADLGPGECRLDLLLGHIELGIGPRWKELSELFERMAAEGEMA